MKVDLRVRRESERHLKSKERLGKACVPRPGAQHLQQCFINMSNENRQQKGYS
jgi:hypothetical protein